MRKTLLTIAFIVLAIGVKAQKAAITLSNASPASLMYQFDTPMVAKDTTYSIENNKPVRCISYKTSLLKKPYIVSIEDMFNGMSWIFYTTTIRPVMDDAVTSGWSKSTLPYIQLAPYKP